MTLKEENFNYQPDEKIVLHSQKYLDEFAIGFAEWCLSIFGRLRDREITIDEALEIYKKEKGL
jgi:hypothetical protein